MFDNISYGDLFLRRFKRLFFVVIIAIATISNTYAQSNRSILNTEIQLDCYFSGNSDSLINIISNKIGTTISYSNRVYYPSKISLKYTHGTLEQFLNDIFYRFPIEYIEKDKRVIIAPQKARYYKISGYCRDATSQESLIGANIYDTLLFVGKSTNEYGFFSINMPEGQATIKASFIGYQPQIRTLNIKNDTIINFQLMPSLLIKEINVVFDQSSKDQTSVGTIEIPTEQIRIMPSLLGETDVIKAFQLTPGVQSGEEGYGGISVRGGGADQNIVLLDDVPLYCPNHLMGLYSIFNIESVNNAKLVKSGFPARYGGRLSSVLDIKTKEGDMNKYGGIANIGLFASSIMFEGPIIKDKMSFTISARRTYFDLFSAQLQRNNDHKYSFYFYDVSTKLNYILSQRDRMYLSFFTGYDNLNYGYNFHNIDILYGKYDKKIISVNDSQTLKWGNLITSFRWNHIWGSSLFSNTTIFFSRYRFRNDLTSQSESEYELKHKYFSGVNDWGTRIDFNWYAPLNNSIRFGVNFTYHAFYPSFSLYQATDNETKTSFNSTNSNSFYRLEYHAYAEDEYNIGNFTTNIGIHMSALNRDKQHPYIRIEPRLSAEYKFQNKLKLRLGYTDMTQFLQLMRMTSVASPADIWLPISSELPPPRAQQFSFETNIPLGKTFSFATEIYYKRYINQQTYKTSPLLSNYSPENWNNLFTIGKGDAKGIEFFIQRKSGQLSGWISYALSKSRNKFNAINNGKYFPTDNDRTHSISAFGCYKINETFDISATWTYNTGSPFTISNKRYTIKGDNNINSNLYFPIEGKRNGYRMQDSHMLNIGFNMSRVHEHTSTTFSIGVYNIYAKKNPMFVYWNENNDNNDNKYTYELKQFSLIAWPWPYIRYSIKF